MKQLFVISLLIFIAISGSRLSFFNRRLSLGFKNIMLTGTEYILIGVLLGNLGFKLIDLNTFLTFEPILIFGLSAIGLLFGLQFNLVQLKKIPTNYFLVSFFQSFFTFLIVSVVMYFSLDSFLDLNKNALILVSLTIGSFSSCTAQSGLAIVGQNYRFKNHKTFEMLRYVSSIDGFYAITFFIFALSLFADGDLTDISFSSSASWFFLSIFMGILPAIIFIILSRTRFSRQEFFAFLVGTILFCGGISYQINYSPLISGFVCGIVIANFCRHSFRALSSIIKSEKSIYIILLVFLGAIWEINTVSIFCISLIYVLSRSIGKIFGTNIGVDVFYKDKSYPKLLGLGLLSEGGISIAIVMSFKLLYPELAAPLISVTIISVFFNELFSPFLILRQFKKSEMINENIRQKAIKHYSDKNIKHKVK